MHYCLSIVSAERICAELDKLIMSTDLTGALVRDRTGLAEEFLPEPPAMRLEQDPITPRRVRDALDAHPSAGLDQQVMVRDLRQGGQGVARGRRAGGDGKTFALGIARHAWQLDGYRLPAAAPTGIATMSLQGEGFEEVATRDRLLGDLDRGREQLDPDGAGGG